MFDSLCATLPAMEFTNTSSCSRLVVRVPLGLVPGESVSVFVRNVNGTESNSLINHHDHHAIT